MAATTFPVWSAGSRITSALLNEGLPLTVIKPTDESVTSSATLQNDNDLYAPVVANGTYIFRCFLDYEGGTEGSSDLQWKWAGPSGTSGRYTVLSRTTAGVLAVAPLLTLTTIGVAGTNGASNTFGVLMDGSFTAGSSPGTFQLEWAQSTSSSTATIVHAMSYLWLQRVS